jgi:hypothetical protein
MTEEKTELPTTEEPKEEPKAGEIDVDGLMAQLEKAGVTSIEDLDGKLAASSQAGNSARLLGEERKESQRLRDELVTTQRPKQQQDFMEYGEGQTINIEDAIEKSVTKVFTKQAENQRKAQEAQLVSYNKITSHPNYEFVKEEFEVKLKDPNYVYQVNAGAIDPVADFYDTVIRKQQILMKESHKTITQLTGGKVEPPHVETGERSPSNLVSETPPQTDREKERIGLKKKVDSGQILSQEEELSIVDSLFNDPQGVPPR